MDNKNNLIYETVGIILINGKKRYLTKDNTLMENSLGIMDKEGRFLLFSSFETITPYREYAIVEKVTREKQKKVSRFGLIDENGFYVQECNYSSIDRLKQDLLSANKKSSKEISVHVLRGKQKIKKFNRTMNYHR